MDKHKLEYIKKYESRQYARLWESFYREELSDSEYILFATLLKTERNRKATNTIAWIVGIQFALSVIAAVVILNQ